MNHIDEKCNILLELRKLPLKKKQSSDSIYCVYNTNRAFSLSFVGNSTKGLSPDLLLLGNKQVGFHNVEHTCISRMTCDPCAVYLNVCGSVI